MKKATTRMRVIAATEAKNELRELLKQPDNAVDHLVVEQNGIPVVAIIPIADYKRLLEAEGAAPATHPKVTRANRMSEARKRLRTVLARVHAKAPAVSAAEAEQDIRQAVRAVRARP